MRWPIDKPPKEYCTDLTVPQQVRGDRYWVRITTKNWTVLTQWRGSPQQIDRNIESWYSRDALAIEVQLIDIL